jgi:HD-GYP domain-containing protein (c-di-GMP phosphodiesterase class II)
MPAGKAAQILREGRGQQWESIIVDAFLRYLEKEHPQARLQASATNVDLGTTTMALAEPSTV